MKTKKERRRGKVFTLKKFVLLLDEHYVCSRCITIACCTNGKKKNSLNALGSNLLLFFFERKASDEKRRKKKMVFILILSSNVVSCLSRSMLMYNMKLLFYFF